MTTTGSSPSDGGSARRVRALALNCALSVAVTAVLGLGLEGGARLVESRRPSRAAVADYIWDWDSMMPGGFYVMKSEGIGWPPWEEFNGDGLRDRTRPREKADGLRRVAVLGDSVTLGAGLAPSEAYPQLLETRFQEEGRPLEVINVGLWGWSTRQERIAWQRIARLYHPDTVLLAVCLNDIPELHNNLSRPPRWLAALFERSALVRLITNAEGREIESVERLFSDAGTPRVEQAMAGFFDEVRALRREAEAERVSFGLLVFPFRFQVEPGAPPPRVQQRIAAFCAAERLPCLDLLPVLAPLGAEAFVDYDHLSFRGSMAAANAVFESGLLPKEESGLETLARLLAGRQALAARIWKWVRTRSGPLESGTAVPLTTILAEGDRTSRLAAIWALAGSNPGPVAEAALVRALREDPSSGARARAASVLGGMGRNPTVQAALVAALSDPSEAVRYEAARALAKNPPQADDVVWLARALESPDDYVSAFAAWTLGNLGTSAQQAVPALAKALARDRTNAVVTGALARIGPAAGAAVPVLLEGLRSPNADRRWRAARTLGRIGPAASQAMAPLRTALADESPVVRLHVARALGRLGATARPAAPDLQRATGDEDEGVRREARKALERLQ